MLTLLRNILSRCFSRSSGGEDTEEDDIDWGIGNHTEPCILTCVQIQAHDEIIDEGEGLKI